MITVTLNKVNGADITNDIRGIQASDVVAGSLRPVTANDTGTAAIFKVQIPNGSSPSGFEIQEWQVTETYAVILSALTADIQDGAPINSPTFTGVPAAPTAADGTDTTQLATTAFVKNFDEAKEIAGTVTFVAGVAALPIGPASVSKITANSRVYLGDITALNASPAIGVAHSVVNVAATSCTVTMLDATGATETDDVTTRAFTIYF